MMLIYRKCVQIHIPVPSLWSQSREKMEWFSPLMAISEQQGTSAPDTMYAKSYCLIGQGIYTSISTSQVLFVADEIQTGLGRTGK